MYYVLTKTIFKKDAEDRVIEMARDSRPIIEKQPGLASVTQHMAHDNSHLMTYWVWETEQDHLNCMASPDWAQFNKTWEAMLTSGDISFELDIYRALD